MDFLINSKDIAKLYSSSGNNGCFASDKITKDGNKIGYMYREEPDANFPDSGWRFFAGDESEDYTNNPNNFHIFDLNTICNYDPSIIEYLNAPYNTYWIRSSEGFILDN